MKKRLWKLATISTTIISAAAGMSLVISCGSSKNTTSTDNLFSKPDHTYAQFASAFPQFKDKIVQNKIVDNAFEGVVLPDNFFLPDSVDEFGIASFRGATINSSFNFPRSLDVIAKYAFQRANLPDDFEVPKKMKSVGEKSFGDLQIPANFLFDPYLNELAVNPNTFSGSNLKSGAKVSLTTYIALKQYGGDYDLTASIDTVNDWLFPPKLVTIPRFSFRAAVLPKEFVIPSWVKEIDINAFEGAALPEGFILPAIIVRSLAFNNSKINDGFMIENIGDAVKWGSNVFQGASLINPDAKFDTFTYNTLLSENIGLTDDNWNIIDISKVVKNKAIPQYTYQNIDFTTGVGKLAWDTYFKNELSDGNLVDAIDSTSFRGCHFPADFNTVPANITRLEYNAFNKVTFDGDFTIPNTIKTYGENVFQEAKFQKNLTYDSSIVPTGVLVSATWNGSFSWGNNQNLITTIGKSAFSGVKFATGFALPKNISSIENSAFERTEFKGKITIDATYPNLKSTGDGIFSRTIFREGADLSHSLISEFGKGAFKESVFSTKDAAKGLLLPTNLTNVSDSMLEGVWLPNGFALPTTVQIIGSSAFQDAKLNDTFTLKNNTSIKEIGKMAFSSLANLTSLDGNIYQNKEEKLGTSSKVAAVGATAYPTDEFNNSMAPGKNPIPDSFELPQIANLIIRTSAFESSIIPSKLTLGNFDDSAIVLWDAIFKGCDFTNATAFKLPKNIKKIPANTFFGAFFGLTFKLFDETSTDYKASSVIEIGTSAFQNVSTEDKTKPNVVPINLKDFTSLEKIYSLAFGYTTLSMDFQFGTLNSNYTLLGEKIFFVAKGWDTHASEVKDIVWSSQDPQTGNPVNGATISIKP